MSAQYASYRAEYNASPNTRTSRLTDKDKQTIVRLYKRTDMTQRQIADRFQVSVPRVSQIVRQYS